MKILFLYTKFDTALKEKIQLLTAHNAEVATLSLLEYKLIEDDHTIQMNPSSRLEFLEKNSGKFSVLNRILKRKSLLSSLEDYDIIDIYKCEKSALFIVDEIREKCYDFFVTPSDEELKTNILTKQFYKYLYQKARFILFSDSKIKNNFNYGYEDKSRLIYEGVPLLEVLDKISEEEKLKASYVMGFDLEKDIIYCDMSGTLQKQINFIDDLLTLPIERLRQSTFIFHLNAHTLSERKVLKAQLEEKNFDYLLIEALLTPKQSALLYKIADKSLILSDSAALVHSLYSENHTYLYKDIMIDDIYTKESLFIDRFTNFIDQKVKDNAMIKEALRDNKEKIEIIFSPDESISRYIEVLKEV